ncbi:MAG: metal ABC transporter permease [Fibrobacteres bacterium]|nr:metal ABC transporter permease [Fibrobacterota bacterium]
MELWSSLISALPFSWTEFSFMHNALLAIIIISPLFAMLGCMIVSSRMAFFSDAIGHSGLTGIAIGAILGLTQPLWAMIVFSLFLAVAITWLRRNSGSSSDSVIGIVMAFTVSVGIVILSRNGGFSRYSSFLIGDILSINGSDIALIFVVFLLFIVCWIFFFNKLLLVTVNTSLARSRNIPVWLTEGIFAAITALIVTLSIQWIGILIINALLILPAAASRNIAKSTAEYVRLSVIISLLSCVSGLISSFYLSTATGATIVIFAMFFYVVTTVIRILRSKNHG